MRAHINFWTASRHPLVSPPYKFKFLATSCHEIRTTLNGAVGMLGLLVEIEQTAVQKEYTATALTSGKALVSLISDILDLSKIESGHMDLGSIPLDLFLEVDDAVSLFESKAAEKGIQGVALVQLPVSARLIGGLPPPLPPATPRHLQSLNGVEVGGE